MTELTPHEGQLPLDQAKVSYYPDFIPPRQAAELFDLFLSKIDWRADRIQVFGKWYDQPRLTALYGETGKSYTYSGITMRPKSFTPELEMLRQKAELVAGKRFSSCLLNLYRDGQDSNGWHADDEAELGPDPVIASISLGCERYFQFRRKSQPRDTYKLPLKSGSLLLMAGETQTHWQHQIPKSKRITEARINLTFRWIKPQP